MCMSTTVMMMQQPLRQIGGRSPGSRDSRRSPSQANLNSDKVPVRYKGLVEMMSGFQVHELKQSSSRSIDCAQVVVVVMEMTLTHVSIHTRKIPAESAETNCAGALDDEELFVIEGSKTGAQLRDNPEERENAEKPRKNPSSPPTAESCTVCTVGTRLCEELECLKTLAMN